MKFELSSYWLMSSEQMAAGARHLRVNYQGLGSARNTSTQSPVLSAETADIFSFSSLHSNVTSL